MNLKLYLCWSVVVAMAACGTDPQISPPPPSDPGKVVVRVDPAGTADCPFGGSVVNSGLDANHNQMLDDGEIATRTVLCNAAPVTPAPAPATLVKLVAEPAGAHCAQGGTAVESGPDANGNGQLDADEVVATDYVCGQALLSRFATEPAGANCIAGGLVFFVGRDRDGDGTLEDGEIEQTQFECGDILARDVAITSDSDVAALANIRAITGMLTISGSGITSVELPQLGELGSLSVSTGKLIALVLPVLRDIQGFVGISSNTELATITAPMLQHVGGELVLDRNAQLTDLAGTAIGTVDGDVQITNNAALTSLGGLVSSGGRGLLITNNPLLAKLAWFPRVPLFGFDIENNGITSLDLATDLIDGAAVLGNVEVINNPQLKSVFIDASQLGSLGIHGNTQLASVMVTGSGVQGNVTVAGNGNVKQITLGNLNDLDPFEITGSLNISEPITQFTSFLGPIFVDGNCTFDSTQLDGLTPGPLARVGGVLTLSNNRDMTEVFGFSVGRGIQLTDNAALTSADFFDQSLKSTTDYAGDVVVTGNPVLKNTQLLSGVTHIGGNLIIQNNAALAATFTDSLNSVDGQIDITDSPKLFALGLTNLAIAHINVINDPAVTKLDLPAFVSGSLTADHDATLGELSLAAARSVDLQVTNNPVLPACAVIALFAGLSGGSHVQSGNDDAAVCPAP